MMDGITIVMVIGGVESRRIIAAKPLEIVPLIPPSGQGGSGWTELKE